MKNLTWLVLGLTGFGADSAFAAPHSLAELACKVGGGGKTLDCGLKESELASFIDQARGGAYLTVESRKGVKRTFSLDPNSSEVQKFLELEKAKAPMAELLKAKLDIFSSIERKVTKISEALDETVPKESKKDAQKEAKKEGKKTLEESALDVQLEEANLYRKNLTHYLSVILHTMQDPGSCTDSFNLRTEKDGGVDIHQINELSKLFQAKCRREKTEIAPDCVARAEEPKMGDAPSVPVPVLVPPPAAPPNPYGALFQKLAAAKADDNARLSCEAKYSFGPFVIVDGKENGSATCYGLSQCRGPGVGKEKTRVACSAEVIDGHFVCPVPEKCLKNGQVVVVDKDVTVK
jgi:hypothetical protein